MPRVVAGDFRGIQLDAPKGDNTRPTGDKVKEALFSIIQSRVPDCDFLELFAGTGQVGIEALSRGANSVILVEKAGPACGVIKTNLKKIKRENSDEITLIRGGYEQVLNKLVEEGKTFDIIFMDPPYRMAEKSAQIVCDIIANSNVLNEDGILIVEHSSDLPFVTDVMNLKFNRSCNYGLAVLSFFSK